MSILHLNTVCPRGARVRRRTVPWVADDAAPLWHTVFERRMLIAIRPRSYPTNSLYGRFHFSARRLAMRF